MKKILSVLLASLLLLSTSATAFAMETETNADNWLVSANQHQIIHNAKIAAETGQNVTLTTKILSDLSDNHFELVEVGDTGYMIFDPQSGKYLEEALDSPSPYLGLSENLYYFGPLNYYQLSGDKFVHTVIHNEYDMSFAECRSLQSAFDTALQNSRTQKDTEVLALMQTNLNSRASVNRLQSHFSARATNKYIPNYKYIKNAIYPANENNTCGYTAACLILNYWHKVKGNVIDSSFLDSNGNLKTTGNTLQDKLLSYGKSNSSWGLTIRDVLIDYCNEYGVAATSTYYVTNFDIFAEVGRNRPVIVFGYFPDSPGQVQSRGKVFHAVTAYGTSTSGLVTKLIVHYGWSGYSHVTLDGGLVGSSTQFVLNYTRKLSMKKVFTFFLAMAIIFGISGCGKKEYIVFPFSASDVVKIETYYSNSEADTKEKTLTEEADIDYLYTFFSELPVKDANSDSTNDGSTIKFVFDLSDGTNYELVYIGIATKKGYLQSETSDFYYFTSSDIIGVWANLSKMRLDF